jgi:hypothetical protein
MNQWQGCLLIFFGLLEGRGDRHWHEWTGHRDHWQHALWYPLPNAKFDYWECDGCTYVLEECYRCKKCERMMCVDCMEIISDDFCKYCGVFMCEDCFAEEGFGAAPATFVVCDDCRKKACATCSLEDGHKAVYCAGCDHVYCAECACHNFDNCEDCSKLWCSDWCSEFTGKYCENDKCSINLGDECNEARGEHHNITSCSGCSSTRCRECWDEEFDLHDGMCRECYSE